ncbi:Protein of unknown function [Bacillus wiedmannii]|nr:Protein of unknown function [Bacillus wiedmannii]
MGGIPHLLLVEPIGLLQAVDPPPIFFAFAEFEVGVLLPVKVG